MQIIPILHDLRSTYNVGAILRTAEGFGCQTVLFSGYTPFPGPTPQTLPHIATKITNQIHKTALGAETTLKCTYLTDLKTFLKTHSAPVVALENNITDPRLRPLKLVKSALASLPSSASPSHSPGQTTLLKTASPQTAYLLLGTEVTGISPDLYPYVTLFAEIPMRGHKESFNVSVAAGIALYELTA